MAEENKPTPSVAAAKGPPPVEACVWCGGYHNFACPYIEEMEFWPKDGSLKRIKLFARPDLLDEVIGDLEEAVEHLKEKNGTEGNPA